MIDVRRQTKMVIQEKRIEKASLVLSQDTDWIIDGACRSATGELAGLFYSIRRRDVKFAKSYCERCPVVKQCYEHAVKNKEPGGVWGGVSFDLDLPKHAEWKSKYYIDLNERIRRIQVRIEKGHIDGQRISSSEIHSESYDDKSFPATG